MGTAHCPYSFASTTAASFSSTARPPRVRFATPAQLTSHCLGGVACGIVTAVNPEANKRLVNKFYEEVWARGNVEFAEQVLADDYLRHDLRSTQAAPGPLGQAQIARAFREAFPDLQWRIDLLVAEGDLVAARWTASGTHTGPWAGVAPTRRRAEFSGVNIFRFGPDGKVVEIWNHRDDLGLSEQLGVAVYAGAPSAPKS
jgi:steroid delta-isomerase-like uncharacterized protein